LFILLNAVLFIRPAEIIPTVQGWSIYEAVILACLAASFPEVIRLLSPASLARQPITGCVLGLLAAVVFSQLSHGNIYDARMGGFEFFKLVVYFLLLVANVSSAARLRQFLFWLVILISVLTVLAVLQYHEMIKIPALAELEESEVNDETGDLVVTTRLVSTGLFHDPNDLCLMLLGGGWLSLYRFGRRGAGLLRFMWLAPVGLFAYALALTQSRGGFLALLAGVLVLLRSRFGLWKTGLLAALVVPVLILVFSGRQTQVDITNREDTAQARIQLWGEAIGFFREAPIFGIGQNEFVEEMHLVVHNSFVHSFAELGFVGGTLFLGCYCCAVWSLVRLGTLSQRFPDLELTRFRPFLLAAVASYAVGLLSLSRTYVVTTYVILGLAMAYIELRQHGFSRPVLAFNLPLLGRLAGCSVVFLVASYLFVRVFAQWS
jgi:O-antigen ligase